MDDHAGRPAPFDERAKLEELDRVREQIQVYRSQRKALQDEFSRFVQSFREPGHEGPPTSRGEPDALEPEAPAAPLPLEAPPAAEPAERDAAEPEVSLDVVGPRADQAEPALGEAPSAELATSDPQEYTPTAPDAIPFDPPARERSAAGASAKARGLVGLGLVLLAGGTLATWMLRGEGAEEPASTASRSVVPPEPAPGPQAPTAAPTSADGSAAAVQRVTEITTTQRVWMRVIVDGERVLEREVPADTRVPLTARESIVIRTGNAGAVRLSIDGLDQGVLGGEGEVVTRTFDVPAARR